MRATLIMALAIALFAVIFALQNSGGVDVYLGPFSFAAPLALVLLLTLAAGVLAGYLSTFSKMIRLGSEIRKLKNQITELQLGTESQIGLAENSEEVPPQIEAAVLESPPTEASGK